MRAGPPRLAARSTTAEIGSPEGGLILYHNTTLPAGGRPCSADVTRQWDDGGGVTGHAPVSGLCLCHLSRIQTATELRTWTDVAHKVLISCLGARSYVARQAVTISMRYDTRCFPFSLSFPSPMM